MKKSAYDYLKIDLTDFCCKSRYYTLYHLQKYKNEKRS